MRSYAPVLALALIPSLCHGALITFDLTDSAAAGPDRSELFDGNATATLPLEGLSASFSANTGTLNSNKSSFGILAPGDEHGDQLDVADAGAEAVTITFDADVILKELSFKLFGPEDRIDLTIGGTPQTLDASSSRTFDDLLRMGDELQVAFNDSAGGNGVSFNGFQVQTVSTPEPAGLGFLAASTVGWLAARRWKRGRR